MDYMTSNGDLDDALVVREGDGSVVESLNDT